MSDKTTYCRKNIVITINFPFMVKRMSNNYSMLAKSIHNKNLCKITDNEPGVQYETMLQEHLIEIMQHDRMKLDTYLDRMESSVPYRIRKLYRSITDEIDDIMDCSLVSDVS